MISFDFEYYRPRSLNEAVNTCNSLTSQGRKAIYYAGGTEIISMARMNKLHFNAVIDIKEIPECNVLQMQNNGITIGSAVTLTKIAETNLFPLLTKAAKAAADHTSRDKITIGGNICGLIPYHEALLPFLLCDSLVISAGNDGLKKIPLTQVFDQKLKRDKGELLVQIITDKSFADVTFEFVKRTKMEEIDYPLVTIAVIKKDDRIRAAFSGVCDFPFRSQKIEDDLNNTNTRIDERINAAMSHLPGKVADNLQGSAEYRDFVFRNMLMDAVSKVGGLA
jgi:CO/xanthine dehydrogenase FAD-binding subunit